MKRGVLEKVLVYPSAADKRSSVSSAAPPPFYTKPPPPPHPPPPKDGSGMLCLEFWYSLAISPQCCWTPSWVCPLVLTPEIFIYFDQGKPLARRRFYCRRGICIHLTCARIRGGVPSWPQSGGPTRIRANGLVLFSTIGKVIPIGWAIRDKKDTYRKAHQCLLWLEFHPNFPLTPLAIDLGPFGGLMVNRDRLVGHPSSNAFFPDIQ